MSSLAILLSQAQDAYHRASSRAEELGEDAPAELLAARDAAEADLLELIRCRREGIESPPDDVAQRVSQFAAENATRSFHQRVAKELERALEAAGATANAADYFDSSRFVPDPSDPSRPLYRTNSGDLVSISAGIKQELPVSLRKHGKGAELERLKAELAEQMTFVSKCQREAVESHGSSSLITRFVAEKRKADKLREKIKRIEKANTPPPAARQLPEIPESLINALRKAEEAYTKLREIASRSGRQNDLLAAMRGERDVKTAKTDIKQYEEAQSE